MYPTSAVLTSPPVVNAIREMVRAECLAEANRFGPAFFQEHLGRVVHYGLQLAQRTGADARVVELAGWLHDLAAVRDIRCVPTHAQDGARVGRELLLARGFPAEMAGAVARCIESHSAPVAPGAGTLEQICVSNADVMAQIARPAYWCWYLYTVRGLDYAAGRSWLMNRLEGSFGALLPEARELVAPEQAAALLLFHDLA